MGPSYTKSGMEMSSYSMEINRKKKTLRNKDICKSKSNRLLMINKLRIVVAPHLHHRDHKSSPVLVHITPILITKFSVIYFPQIPVI
jgi:UDP-2,3-diacylglucosamine pyrophosphatase LpxH